AKAGRSKRSLSRAATRPTIPGCQPVAAVTMTAPRSSAPSAADASASAAASIDCSIAWRSRLRRARSPAGWGRFADTPPRATARAQIGAADAAARVDARAKQKAEVPGLGRAGKPRHVHERGEPDAFAPAHGDEALGDEGAVEAFEARYVGDSAERDQIEQAEEI